MLTTDLMIGDWMKINDEGNLWNSCKKKILKEDKICYTNKKTQILFMQFTWQIKDEKTILKYSFHHSHQNWKVKLICWARKPLD